MDESTGARRAVEAGRAHSAIRDPHDAVWKDYVDGCARRDASALAKLYDESSALVYSVALRVLANVADAEEVALDVYSQVWRSAPGYDSARGSVTAWLVTIARSRAIDKVRARTIRANREELLEASNHGTPAADPETHTSLKERRGRIVAAMNKLTTDQRIAIELAFFSGLSHSELALRLGAPLGTVKTRIRLGMVRLRELLEGVS